MSKYLRAPAIVPVGLVMERLEAGTKEILW